MRSWQLRRRDIRHRNGKGALTGGLLRKVEDRTMEFFGPFTICQRRHLAPPNSRGATAGVCSLRSLRLGPMAGCWATPCSAAGRAGTRACRAGRPHPLPTASSCIPFTTSTRYLEDTVSIFQNYVNSSDMLKGQSRVKRRSSEKPVLGRLSAKRSYALDYVARWKSTL